MQRRAPAAPSNSCKKSFQLVKIVIFLKNELTRGALTEVFMVVVTKAYEVGMVIVEVLVLVDENK